MASKISSLSLQKGRKFAYYGSITLGLGIFTAKYLPNTFLLDYYQDVVQMYRMGMGVPVPQKITDRLEQVLGDMKVPDKERKLFKLFTVLGFDLFHAGTTWAKTGCIIGIPKNYAYDRCDEIEKSEIIVNQNPVSWSTPAGKALEEAVVLSPEAQKYAIAYQVSLCRSPYLFFLALYPMLSTYFAYGLASTLNRNLQLHARKVYVRGTMYSIVGLFAFGLWVFATDFTTVTYEEKADLKACDLGPDYVRGGVEFYNKILSRNVALRTLMGKEGEKVFTAFGNDQILFRQKHLPITVRKCQLEKKMQDIIVRTKSEQVKSGI